MEVTARVETPKEFATDSTSRTRSLFGSGFADPAPEQRASKGSLSHRTRTEYGATLQLPPSLASKMAQAQGNKRKRVQISAYQSIPQPNVTPAGPSNALVQQDAPPKPIPHGTPEASTTSSSLIRRDAAKQPKPQWQPPWKLMRVISGHLGWVRALTVDPDNRWFASGAGDRTIKIWDLASGTLQLTLTGHISTVRGLAVSARHPYLFSCGEDKMVKCWDLETNKVIRHYHGHLSGVYTLDLHPTLDVLATGGRDGVTRVWDMRSRSNIHVLGGHKQTVSSIRCQEADPQIISGSLDSTVRLWDLAAGKSMGVLTHHKKGVRALATHPKEFTFASSSTNAIKQWKCPEGVLMQNFEGHNSIINTLAVNEDGVLMSGGDDGSMCFWDWNTGHQFQRLESIAQPGSLEAEAGLMSSTYDQTGLRLITGEADKTIKVWKQDENATEDTHPLQWKPSMRHKKF